MVLCHLGADVLVSIIDEGEECAVAVQLEYAMLDERVERDVAARQGVGRRAFSNVKRKRGGGEVARTSGERLDQDMRATSSSYAAISYARTRS